MGAEATNSLAPPAFSLSAEPIQQQAADNSGGPVIQRKAVDQEGHYGKFKPENYGKSSDGKKLHAAIKFEPNEKVDATKIGFTQVIRKNVDGNDVAIDPAGDTRMVDSGAGEGFRIDRISNKNNPIYGASDLSGTDGLDKTKETNNSSGKTTGWTQTKAAMRPMSSVTATMMPAAPLKKKTPAYTMVPPSRTTASAPWNLKVQRWPLKAA